MQISLPTSSNMAKGEKNALNRAELIIVSFNLELSDNKTGEGLNTIFIVHFGDIRS